MVNDRAGHARHEDPVLPSRDVNRTQLRAGPRASDHELSSLDLPLSLPQSPILCLTPGRSRADFLSSVRVALIGSRSARYFSPTCSPRARICQHVWRVASRWNPLRHLRPLPSSPAGFRSTFDRLPYGCLLFMYRLDLT